MPSFEMMLEQILLGKGSGVSEPLSGALKRTYGRQLLTLSLESIHGPFFTTGSADVPPSDGERNFNALPSLTGGPKNEKRFFFTMSDRRWEVLSAFTLTTSPFFTTLTLDISDPASAPIRSRLFKLADYFTVQCRKLLQGYCDAVFRQQPTSGQPADQFGIEKSILRKIIDFSAHVHCAVLLDEDGFIIHTEGSSGSVDELGGALARLFYRSNHEIARLDCADCHAVTIADQEYTIRIGRLAGTSLAFAVSVEGPHATSFAHFLHKVASEALTDHAWRTGQLWGVAVAELPEPARIRESWFSPPRLLPHGKFVGKKGGKSFHAANCQILAKTDPSLLQWFKSRAIAIENGLRPCGACNP
ncbi:MAG: hypothetical protein JW913_02620 [Chitinispirillaceae bacterium]|nr:hypothetical protein [Chitinispirillaceae bacterium]